MRTSAAGRRRFRARIEDAGGGGAFVRVPFDVEHVFGSKRVPVRAQFDGEPYRGTLVRMGLPEHLLIVLKSIRARIGKGIGDTVTVVIERDDAPRVVAVPADLARALRASPAAAANFRRLAYSHRREYVNWITEAKRAATRAARIERALQLLAAGRRAK
jgi:hypothetical protein